MQFDHILCNLAVTLTQCKLLTGQFEFDQLKILSVYWVRVLVSVNHFKAFLIPFKEGPFKDLKTAAVYMMLQH